MKGFLSLVGAPLVGAHPGADSATVGAHKGRPNEARQVGACEAPYTVVTPAASFCAVCFTNFKSNFPLPITGSDSTW